MNLFFDRQYGKRKLFKKKYLYIETRIIGWNEIDSRYFCILFVTFYDF